MQEAPQGAALLRMCQKRKINRVGGFIQCQNRSPFGHSCTARAAFHSALSKSEKKVGRFEVSGRELNATTQE